MNKILNKLYLITLLLTVSVSAYALKPGEKMPPPSPMLPHSESFELVPVQINLGLDGKAVSLEAKACASCKNKRYLIGKETRFYAGTKLLSHDEISSFNGHIADLIYIPEGLSLVQASFHKVEK